MGIFPTRPRDADLRRRANDVRDAALSLSC
jgi:hypothetical protein